MAHRDSNPKNLLLFYCVSIMSHSVFIRDVQGYQRMCSSVIQRMQWEIRSPHIGREEAGSQTHTHTHTHTVKEEGYGL